MKLRFYLLALVLVTAFGTRAGAQPPERVEKLERARNVLGDKAKDGGINEDIEIMRRLLIGRLAGRDSYVGGTYPNASSWLRYNHALAATQNLNPINTQYFVSNDANSYPNARSSALTAEGVHLGDKGVWFSITMPATQRDPWPTTTVAPAKNVSDWDRARQQLRGESPEPAAKTEAPQPSTSDIILAVLAENGKNLRIKNNEDVIVVVTFRNAAAAQSNPFLNLQPTANPTTNTATPEQKSLLTLDNRLNAEASGHGKSARDFILLGDLHLRQQQYGQALEAFEQALKVEPQASQKQQAEAFRKLAETKLHLGQLDAARAMIERAMEWEKKTGTPALDKPKPDQPAQPATQWPAKLIIMTDKQTLDDVGAGKISAEEFRKKVKLGKESASPSK